MVKVNIKPLSNNDMYGGRKVKSYKYRNFEREMLSLLPDDYEIPEGKLSLLLVVGFSSKLSDLDNAFKPFIDCLQLKYGFNDKRIYYIEAYKEDVKRGKEFIEFEIGGMDE